MTSANSQAFQSSWIRSTYTYLVLVGHKRTHTTVRKEQGTQTPVLWSTFTHHIIHIMGWVGTVSLWTESGCQWCLCMLTSKLTVHMLKMYRKEGTSVVLSSTALHSFIPSFIHPFTFRTFLTNSFYQNQHDSGLSLACGMTSS